MSTGSVATLTSTPVQAPGIFAQRPLAGGPAAPTGPPPDGAALNERQAGPPKAGDLQGLMQDHAEKDRLINGMLVAQGPTRPSEGEAAQLRGALGAVDTNVLRFAKDSDLKVGVLSPGEEMFESGLLRRQDPNAIEQKTPEMRAFTARTNAELDQKYGNPLNGLHKELEGLPPAPLMGFGGGAADPHAEKRNQLIKRIDDLEGQKSKALNAAVEQSGLPIKPYSPKPLPDGAGGLGAMQANLMMMKMPVNTEVMAANHGATTPEQKKQFMGMVEQINGDRLTQARADMLRQTEESAARATDPQQKAALLELAKNGRAHPERVPVDFRKYNIMVPDMHYGTDDKGKPVVLDTHDTMTLSDWAGQGTKAEKPWDRETRTGSQIDGQYFSRGGMNSMVVRDREIGTASVHELGHSIDFQMEKKDPQFYAGWKPRLEEAHAKASDFFKGKTISEYAKTNPREYIAEGVSHYYSDPKGLKAADPALYQLTEELLTRAGQLGAGK